MTSLGVTCAANSQSSTAETGHAVTSTGGSADRSPLDEPAQNMQQAAGPTLPQAPARQLVSMSSCPCRSRITISPAQRPMIPTEMTSGTDTGRPPGPTPHLYPQPLLPVGRGTPSARAQSHDRFISVDSRPHPDLAASCLREGGLFDAADRRERHAECVLRRHGAGPRSAQLVVDDAQSDRSELARDGVVILHNCCTSAPMIVPPASGPEAGGP